MLEYQLIRSARRKTLGLQVKQGRVIVRAPCYLTDSQIVHFINQKSAWLQTKIDLQKQQAEPKLPNFTAGSLLWIKGEQKPLTIGYQAKAEILNLPDEFRVLIPLNADLENDQLSSIKIDQQKVKTQLEKWFKAEATSYLSTRLTELSEQTQLIPKSVKIRQYKARWGSCNNRGELSFNYLLMMAPLWVVDYVIVHELCHLTHLNHSKAFWQLVAQHSLHYQRAKDWLKNHQRQLTW